MLMLLLIVQRMSSTLNCYFYSMPLIQWQNYGGPLYFVCWPPTSLRSPGIGGVPRPPASFEKRRSVSVILPLEDKDYQGDSVGKKV